MTEKLTERIVRKWLKSTTPRLKRVTTRTLICRVLEAVKRMDFEKNKFAEEWTKGKFIRSPETTVYLIDDNDKVLQEFNPSVYIHFLLNQIFYIGEIIFCRNEVKAEQGHWKTKGFTKGKKLISVGGEAIVFASKLGILGDICVRAQAFDSAVFTSSFEEDEYVYKINLCSNYVQADGNDDDKQKSIHFAKI